MIFDPQGNSSKDDKLIARSGKEFRKLRREAQRAQAKRNAQALIGRASAQAYRQAEIARAQREGRILIEKIGSFHVEEDGSFTPITDEQMAAAAAEEAREHGE